MSGNGKGKAAPKFKRDPKNARKHGERNKAFIRQSLEEVGPLLSIGVDGDNIIRAGNGVWEQSEALGLKVRVIDAKPNELIAVRRKDLKGTAAVRAAIFDNKASDLSEWDSAILREIEERDHAALAGMFERDEWHDILARDAPEAGTADAEPQIDRAEELNKKWQVKTGDLWRIGEHRLLCGDSTRREDVERVMQGWKAELLFTSPPYSDVRDYGGNDLSVKTLAQFIACFSDSDYQAVNLGIVRKNDEVIEYWNDYITTARQAGYKLLSWNVWDKMLAGSISNQSAMFAIEHEFIFIFGKASKALSRTVEKSPDSHKRLAYNRRDAQGRLVRAVRQPDGTMRDSIKGQEYALKNLPTIIQLVPEMKRDITDKHPAIFPVDLPSIYIEAMTKSGDTVAEPFVGSGTTIVACQNLHRKCRAIEIGPAYCAVTLERMATAFPGIEIERLNGKTQTHQQAPNGKGKSK